MIISMNVVIQNRFLRHNPRQNQKKKLMSVQTEEYPLPNRNENRRPLPNTLPYAINCKARSQDSGEQQPSLHSLSSKRTKTEELHPSTSPSQDKDKEINTKKVLSQDLERDTSSTDQNSNMQDEKRPQSFNESRSESSQGETKQYPSRKESQSQLIPKQPPSLPPPEQIIPQQPVVVVQRLTMIRQGQYSRNRIYLYGWMRRQCQKFKLQLQTYANAAVLMDEYYKYMQFEKEHFIMTALCFMIISSKALETKVLFTSGVAEANKYNYPQMLKAEEDVLVFFQFQVVSYNFARLCAQYMRRWDETMRRLQHVPVECMFFQPVEASYLQYIKTMFLCENQMRYKGSILLTAIKEIFRFLLLPACPPQIEAELVINRIFSEPHEQTSLECLFAYDIQQETETKLRESLQGWVKEFQGKPQTDARRAFKKYADGMQDYKSYGDFLAMLQP